VAIVTGLLLAGTDREGHTAGVEPRTVTAEPGGDARGVGGRTENVAMATSVSRPGIGLLTLERGPGELSVWRLQQPVTSSAYPDPIPVHILVEGADGLELVDVPLIAQVLAHVDDYLAAGLRFVYATMLTDPARFGLTDDEAAAYGDVRAEDLPLDDPQLVFYTDSEWLLHFQQGRLPICDPHGLAVFFDQRQPARVEDLSDAEPID
jgi:hypothetical protein